MVGARECDRKVSSWSYHATVLDAILEAVGLVSIEHVPSGRGKDKIVYVVHDPLTVEEFDSGIGRIKERLKTLVTEDEAVIKLLGKQRADEFRL